MQLKIDETLYTQRADGEWDTGENNQNNKEHNLQNKSRKKRQERTKITEYQISSDEAKHESNTETHYWNDKEGAGTKNSSLQEDSQYNGNNIEMNQEQEPKNSKTSENPEAETRDQDTPGALTICRRCLCKRGLFVCALQMETTGSTWCAVNDPTLMQQCGNLEWQVHVAEMSVSMVTILGWKKIWCDSAPSLATRLWSTAR